NKDYDYGILSHRNIEEMLNTTRQLDGQDEKRSKVDFALWKKASPEHIMRWKSPWSVGFPGWHIECSTMSIKYLGSEFDIHGGGLDLMFPHHECEIAQNTAVEKHRVVKYWMHNNMITIGGQKMGKSLGNFITLDEFFEGSHSLLKQAYSPMTIRFFILQAHYRSTVDFSNEALQASEKGLSRLLEAYARIPKISPSAASSVDIKTIRRKCYDALNDDLNSAMVIAELCEAVTIINSAVDGKVQVSEDNIAELKSLFDVFLFEILGIKNELNNADKGTEAYTKAIDLLLQIRNEAKMCKDWATSDKIRDELNKIGFEIKDGKDGTEWKMK
ncbi:MAG TPA: cysteine--tRNA ligase, partial [Dysgonomonas sp.]|nr:cysteine--tRNA ligase [Dysgonomonas sp.]